MRTDTFMFRANGFAAVLALTLAAGVPTAGQASPKPAHNSRPAAAATKRTDQDPATQPDAAGEQKPATGGAAPSSAAVAQPAPNGAPVEFSVPPAAEFRIQVPGDPGRLNLVFHVAGGGSLNAYLKFGDSPGKAGINGADYPPFHVTAESHDFPLPASPPLRDGIYYLRLESATAAGGYFVATTVPAAVQRPGNPSRFATLLATLAAPPAWLGAALSVASLACLGLLFMHGIRSSHMLGNEIKAALDSLGLVAGSLRDLKKSVANLPGALADYGHWAEPPAAAKQDALPAHPPAARFQHLLENEPTLVTARLVRDVARRAGGETETEFGLNFAGYLAALDRAERMLAEAAPGTLALDEEWAALNRAIGALQARHNPVFFLDVIDEAARQGMPQKEQLLATLGIEEINPQAGLEIMDLTSYQIEQTTGMGRRSILEKVIASGYRSRETGEVFRKPAIAVRLESGFTAAV
jgi:hypothetical protein